MAIHQKFLKFAEEAMIDWACNHLEQYRARREVLGDYGEQAEEEDDAPPDNYWDEQYELFVNETFHNAHQKWYCFSPQELTIDDIQAILSTNSDHCRHQKECVDFVVPPPDCIHDLLVNYGFYKATQDDRDYLIGWFIMTFVQELCKRSRKIELK